jgi:AcrR family transcriptional regulator
MSGTGSRRRRAVSQEEKSQRRDEIMAAAKEVFAHKGFHAATIADIAKQAGLAYGLIYWYFDSKDELFHALMAAEEEALRAHITAALATASGSLDSDARTGGEAQLRAFLQAAAQATFEFFEAETTTVRLLFGDAYVVGDRFEKHLGGIYDRFIGDIETFVVAAQERGEVVSAPPRMIAYTLAALMGQFAHRRLTTDDDATAAQVADFVVSLLLDGLRPRSAPAESMASVNSCVVHTRPAGLP